MEWKIGEIRQVNGEWYQCVEGNGCENCAFKGRKCYLEGDTDDPIGECCYDRRRDNKDVIFKKLEKVGEPFTLTIHVEERLVPMQEYKLYDVNFCKENALLMYVSDYKHKRVAIEIKQNKEDMEQEIEYFGDENAKCFNSENIEKKLKPFNLKAAKAGKPVCTRDGRKVRIICFDSKNDPQRPIVALVEHNDNELLYEYTIEGKERFSHISTTGTSDLMMLPEKKEGWVNIYRGQVYNTFEKAEEARKIAEHGGDNYLKTIKIDWEE